MSDRAKKTSDGKLRFWCPACKVNHVVGIIHGKNKPVWNWNGDAEHPTLSPSVLVKSGHYVDGHTGECWCNYLAEHPEEDPADTFHCGICHSFVKNGEIQYLPDCTHEMAGKTISLPEI
ncbi:hypothetical protein MQ524_002514 [Salmonella enterica]|nr:hypothetical protein [Salmonella enterica]